MLKHKKTHTSSPSAPLSIKNSKGLTVLEIIVVMVIISIMATFAIPSFLHWLPNIRLKSAGRDLYSNMQTAKVQAIRTNRDWRMSFDPGNNEYSIQDSGDGDWTTLGDNTSTTFSLSDYQSAIGFGHGGATSAIGAIFGGADAVVDNVSYTGNLITFNPRGTCNMGYIYLDNEQGTSLAVGSLNSGVIRYLQWKGTGWQ